MAKTNISNPLVMLVAMADSVHVARWIKLFQNQNVRFILISSSPHRKLHPEIRNLVEASRREKSGFLTIPWVSRYLSLPMWIADKLANDFFRSRVIKFYIKSQRPNIVHAIEMQNAGYPTRLAFKNIKGLKPKLLLTNYGSDIFWFSQFSNHRVKIEKLLAVTDLYLCECKRDQQLAIELNYKGELHPVRANTGGLTYEQYLAGVNSPTCSTRKVLALKGYQGKFGRAATGIRLIPKIMEQVPDTQIEIFSANFSTIRAIRKLPRECSSKIVVHKKHTLTHEEVLSLFRRARVYCGLSVSDGISTSMLEAMSQGALPIQTCTSCADEWIIDGRDGFIVGLDNGEVLLERIVRALKDDQFVDMAKASNLQTIHRRYLSDKLEAELIHLYE